MKKLETIAAIAALGIMVGGGAVAENLPEGFKFEKQEMPKLSGTYSMFPIRWETLPDGSITYHHKSKSLGGVKNYVEGRQYFIKEEDAHKNYFAFFRVCKGIFPKFPYYVSVDEYGVDSDLQVFVDAPFADGISEIVGMIKKNPKGVAPSYDYYKKYWDSFIPPCPKFIS